MFERVTPALLDEYRAFLWQHPKGHFLQSHEWSHVKSSWKWEAVVVRDASGAICGALSVLIRKIVPALPYTLMYAGRGPVCDPHDRATLQALTEGAAALAKEYRAYALQLDPDILSSDTAFCTIMKELGYHHKPGDKNFDGVQPNYVFRLDIAGKTEDELLAAFHSKTRYNLRLSVRKGVTVRLCGKEMLPDFARIMRETGDRDGFITRSEGYFATLLDSLGDNARLYMAFWEDKPIAGTLAIRFGNKVWYLYGASSNAHRNVMPNYQLQWEMIRWALECGCEIYDFRGVSGDLSPDNPLYGLYLFKKGFSGDLCEFSGQFEMIYNKSAYALMTKGVGMARNLRRKLMLRKSSGHAAPPKQTAPAPKSEASEPAQAKPETEQ